MARDRTAEQASSDSYRVADAVHTLAVKMATRAGIHWVEADESTRAILEAAAAVAWARPELVREEAPEDGQDCRVCGAEVSQAPEAVELPGGTPPMHLSMCQHRWVAWRIWVAKQLREAILRGRGHII